MKLYLTQHADALSKEDDPERRLSPTGRADAANMAAFLAAREVRIDRVFHSGKARAMETATLMVPNSAVEAIGGIAPNDPTDVLLAAVQAWDDNIMVVGHLPFMGRMVSVLVAGNEDASVVSFQPGTVVCLERGEDGWTIDWMMRPNL